MDMGRSVRENGFFVSRSVCRVGIAILMFRYAHIGIPELSVTGRDGRAGRRGTIRTAPSVFSV